jgi:hypothetical protein
MTAHSTIAKPDPGPAIVEHANLETYELRTSNLRQRFEALLRKIFEGHEEFLGWTPD